jgi:hypothetical protein
MRPALFGPWGCGCLLSNDTALVGAAGPWRPGGTGGTCRTGLSPSLGELLVNRAGRQSAVSWEGFGGARWDRKLQERRFRPIRRSSAS